MGIKNEYKWQFEKLCNYTNLIYYNLQVEYFLDLRFLKVYISRLNCKRVKYRAVVLLDMAKSQVCKLTTRSILL